MFEQFFENDLDRTSFFKLELSNEQIEKIIFHQEFNRNLMRCDDIFKIFSCVLNGFKFKSERKWLS